MFRKATKKDFTRILKIQDENLLSQNKNLESGFLVYPITLSGLMKNKYIVFVSTENEIVNGYFAGYKLSKRNSLKLHLKRIPEECFYWKHVALSFQSKGTKLGRKFEEHCFSELKKSGFENIIAEICLNPLNKKSLHFHVDIQGLKQVGKYNDRKNYTWGVFTKKLTVGL